MKLEHQTAFGTDRRHRRNAGSPSGHGDLARLAALRPSLAQEWRQANRRLVFAIQNSPGFPQRFANLRDGFLLPAASSFRLGLEGLALGSLPSQTDFAQAPPDRVFRYIVVEAIDQH